MDDRIQLELTTLAHGGEALGRYAGKVVFVPYAAPGERAVVEIIEEKERWARGRLVDILDPSPHRVEPLCPYFGQCKGCQWQHISYPTQLKAKREIVRDQIARLGHLSHVNVREVAGMAAPWQYRNQAHLYPTHDGRLGIKAGSNNQPVGIDECLLFHPLLGELFRSLDLDAADLHRVSLRAGTRTGDQMIIFEPVGDWAPELEADFPVSCVLRPGDDDVRVLVGDEWLWEELAGRRFRVSALSPFPVNTEMAEQMVDAVHDYLLPQVDDLLLDAGGGVGIFGLSFADEVAGVIATEENAWALSDFVVNAGEEATAGIVQGTILEGLSQIENLVDLAVVSPSRSGLGRDGILELGRLGARRLAYVTTDPAILARDAQSMLDIGYRLVEVQPFDAMPQTYQVHLVALWERHNTR